ncbi:serine hydrolase domain-containing protein [Aspergillus affinis]|uniref:serine hydrolase domain-containing protein n=1 Tax=Aspergillus affinis TaxID=1070780 RepID=UPI0022FEE9F1|nr:beta-lactamase/transpeptidase-like protein [Aspergillus affinis]KAI9039315.1 beta-lactamase/transpeptidase-like protein [Aspergillus affinis]
MHLASLVLLGLACLSTAYKYCPPLGPAFPAPKDISKDPAFLAATKNINDALNPVIECNTPMNSFFNPENTSVALQIFSADEPAPLFESYYTSTAARNASLGVNRVDGNTVFRIGSVSKLWTVLLLMIETGNVVFSEPVVKYIPELKDAMNEIHENAIQELNTVDHVRWGEVTIGELASHLSGISRHYGFGDYALQLKEPEVAGLPKFTEKELPPCGATPVCDRDDFFKGLLKKHPVVATGATPIYSNAAFRILGYALEKMTNTSYENLLTRHLIKPLNLTHSSCSAPDAKHGLIPGDTMTSFWGVNAGEDTPAGGLFSSTNDFSAVGRAILNNTLLSPALTRRWFKPVSHTSSLSYAVGSPWEIFSFPNARVVDLYTKSGDMGAYSSVIALSPDHGVGFSILVAGGRTHEVVSYLSDYVATAILPTLDQIAQRAADKRFSGTYVVRDTNSTITISTDDGLGLKVTNWTKGNIPIFEVLSKFSGAESPADLSVRLYPTGLETESRVSFRAVIKDMAKQSPGIGPFTSSCFTWLTVDGMQFNGVGMDEFVFDVDEKGRAVRVSPRAWQYVLERAE